MSRMKNCFANLQQAKQKALIPYITAGDPRKETTVELMHAMVAAGADCIELGMPFSDPMAEGVVIQAAHERALANGVGLSNVLQMVTEFRQQNTSTPLVLMGYLNPIEIYGYEAFAKAAQQAGVDALLLVDLPVEEAKDVAAIFKAHDIDMVFLLSPTTAPKRIPEICNMSGGYHYYVSLKGVTGSNKFDADSVKVHLAEIQPYTYLPVCVGFGISDQESARQAASCADGVIIGSAIVKLMDSNNSNEVINQDVANFLASIKAVIS